MKTATCLHPPFMLTPADHISKGLVQCQNCDSYFYLESKNLKQVPRGIKTGFEPKFKKDRFWIWHAIGWASLAFALTLAIFR